MNGWVEQVLMVPYRCVAYLSTNSRNNCVRQVLSWPILIMGKLRTGEVK